MKSTAKYGVAALPWQEAGLAKGAGRPIFSLFQRRSSSVGRAAHS
jgi:hypothetical protein